MKTFAFLIAITLLSALSSYAQFQIPEIDKVKEIKLLQSTAFDVQRILVGFETSGWEPGDLSQSFSTENFSIDITYSSGECSEDDDEIWNAKQWTVKWIEIEPSDSLKVKNLGFDLSKFMKEQMYANRPETFIFHDKKKGLAYRVNEEDNEVRSIFIFPPKDTKVGVCKNDKAKEFVSSEGWFGKTKLADRTVIEDFAADITNLTLSTDQLENLTANRQVLSRQLLSTPKMTPSHINISSRVEELSAPGPRSSGTSLAPQWAPTPSPRAPTTAAACAARP